MIKKSDTIILNSIVVAFIAGIITVAGAWYFTAGIITVLLLLTVIGVLGAVYVLVRVREISSNRFEQDENSLDERIEHLNEFMMYRDHQLFNEKNYRELSSRLEKKANAMMWAVAIVSLLIFGNGALLTFRIYTTYDQFSIWILVGLFSIIISPVLVAATIQKREQLLIAAKELKSLTDP